MNALLRNELLTDPLARNYAGMTDAQCLASLKTKNRPRTIALSTLDLLEWSGSNQRFLKIRTAANVAANDTQTENVAAVMLVLLQTPGVALDMRRQAVRDMVDFLVTQSVLTAADRTALQTLATENISRATELGLLEEFLHEAAITKAREQ